MASLLGPKPSKFHLAAATGQVAVVKKMIENGANVLQKNEQDVNVLHIAGITRMLSLCKSDLVIHLSLTLACVTFAARQCVQCCAGSLK